MLDRSSSTAPKSADDLCQHLAVILREEIAAGNSVSYVERALIDPNGALVMLSSFFKSDPHVEPPVKFIQVSDPHLWSAEYQCSQDHHQLVCPVAVLPIK